MINDSHCHFFSSRFLELLTQDVAGLPETGRATLVAHRLSWEDPGYAETLADRWVSELDRYQVNRAALIASIAGDEESVATAVRHAPSRFVGFFMFNPIAPDASQRLERAIEDLGLRGVCLFPAMHRYHLDDEAVVHVFERAAKHGVAVFVHCGVLSVGVRKRLGLASPFDMRLGDPITLATVAGRYPAVPVIIPHFGAGLFREALMAADQCGNIHFDTSSSNSWIKYYPGLSLEDVFRQALAVVGPSRLLFGTDSSFYPRGWQKPIFDVQMAALSTIGASDEVKAQVLGGNFERLFPVK